LSGPYIKPGQSDIGKIDLQPPSLYPQPQKQINRKMATETLTQITPPNEFPSLPPFPSTIPTAPLHRLSLSKLRQEPSESDRLFAASKNLGFFYLDLQADKDGEELLAQADKLFELGPKLYELGREELQNYDYKSQGSYMGYKGYGSAVVDEKGNLDRNEFYNVRCPIFLLLRNT
jgi:hypothetical protein